MSDSPEPQNVPLAIIGIGCLFPKAGGIKGYWSNIKNKVDAITAIPKSHWAPEDYFDKDPKRADFTYAQKGGFLDPVDFDPAEFGISPNTLEATDSAQLLGLVTAQMALRDAGYGPEKDFDRSRVSVILGVTGTLELVVPLGARLGHPVWRKALKEHGIEGAEAEAIVESIKDGYVPWQENSFPGLLGNVVAGRIANRFNLGGTNCVVDAACASSLSAAHLASLELATGRSKMVVTGGVDCFNDIFMYMCFSKTPALSPSGDAKPFDSKADGTTLGEGLGMVVLKRLDEAERDGDRIYAVLKGVGSSSDGRGKAIYAPSAEGQTHALRAAYQAAGVSPATVELVEAHGTGTTVGDGVEVDALREVYREAQADGVWCALGSVKSMIGHTKAAAGSAGMIKAALSLYHKVLPPTIKVSEPIEQIARGDSPFYLSTEKRPWVRGEQPRRAAVSALGFGGSNFHAVLEEHRPTKVETDWDGDVQIVALSGGLAEIETALREWSSQELSWDEIRVRAAQARAAFAADAACRLCFVIERGKTDLKKLAASALSQLASGKDGWSTPDGVHFAKGRPGKLGVLFPGQGSQYVGMGRDLACQFPQAAKTLAAGTAAFGDGRLLAERIHPKPVFKDAEKTAHEAALRATDVAQPALGVVSLGAFNVLKDFGLKPEAFAGHSYGELTALCAAERLTEGELFAASKRRGELMAGDGGDRGGMLAVQAPVAEIAKLLLEEKLDLVLANKNAPLQSVLSGRTDEVARAAEACKRRGLKSVVLPVAAAFHSPLVAGAQEDFRKALESVKFAKGAVPVYANKTAQPYPEAARDSRDLLASQLASPVEFVALIERMHADGVTTFFEVGPGARLTGLVGAILGEKPHQALAVDASAGRRSGAVDLARALAQLSALGHAVDLGLWEGGLDAVRSLIGRKTPKLAVKLTGANYRSAKLAAKAPAPAKPRIIPQAAAPASAPAMVSAVAPIVPAAGQTSYLAAALKATQESMDALQKLQEQTANLHVRFLEGQEAAQASFQALVEQQQRLFAQMGGGSAVLPPLASVASVPVAAPVAPAPRPVAATPAPTPAAAPAAGTEAVLLAVVSEKTGYPVEMLNPDMDLESDLGIDSIKRVEILSAISEKLPNAPKIKPGQLGTLRTLRQIVAFLSEGQSVPPAAPVAAPAASAGVESTLLVVVSEKTGYPVEMLNPDMDLESDLGIDSIKRVEILSALREKLPGSPEIKPGQLGTLRTLRQIVAFLSAGAPVAAPASASAPAAIASAGVESALLAVVSEKTGYPVEMLNPDMDLESDLGIDSIKRVEILSALREKLPDSPEIKPGQLGTLRTLRQIVAFLSDSPAKLSPGKVETPVAAAPSELSAESEEVSRQVLKAAALSDAPRSKVAVGDAPIWVTDDGSALAKAVAKAFAAHGLKAEVVSLDAARPSVPLSGLVVLAPARKLAAQVLWDEKSEDFLRRAFALACAAAPFLKKSKRALFVTVSRLDGAFGLSGLKSEQDPTQGGLAGLSKTASREWTGVACKALDAASEWTDAAALAGAIVDEALLEGPLEVGLSAAGKRSLELVDSPYEGDEIPALATGDLVLVTGGARGVTAEAAAALASACRPTMALWGRSPMPGQEAPFLKGCGTEAQIKQALLAQAGAERPTPKALGQACQRVLAEREIRAQIARMEAAGAKVIYQSVDVSDQAAVASAMKSLKAAHGPVRALIHGAGVLADKKLEEKTVAQFDAVFGTKVSSLRHILSALDLKQLKGIVLFSSSTARFGRTGQGDYAVANEALNKAAQLLARRLPECRVASMNWGPWDGGMVNDGLKKLFESEGVRVIGLKAGGRSLLRELGSASRACEVVILGAQAKSAAVRADLKSVLERPISVDDHPFLLSHVINGRAVLPFAITAEWLAHAALHGNPGLLFQGFDDLRLYKGVVLKDESPYALSLCAGKAARQGETYAVKAELRGPGGVRHAAATVILGAKRPAAGAAGPAMAAAPFAASAERLYKSSLFHGPDMRFVRAVAGLSAEGVVVESATALPPKSWMRAPARETWTLDPAALDAAFQALIVWSRERLGAGCLPSYVARYRQHRESFPKEGVRLSARVVKSSEHLVAADVDFLDASGALVARLEGCEAAVDASLNDAFLRNELEAAAA